MRLVLLALLLVGCAPAPYWQHDMPPLEPLTVHTNAADTLAMCGYHRACTVRYPDWRIAVIYLGPQADNCTLRHELRHADGWDHDDRQVYRDDCGEG